MLWFTFKVIFETIPGGWLGGSKVIIKLAQSSLSWCLDLAWQNINLKHYNLTINGCEFNFDHYSHNTI
jgi:hypothetical protein